MARLLTELEDKQEMLVNQRKINENMAKKQQQNNWEIHNQNDDFQ